MEARDEAVCCWEALAAFSGAGGGGIYQGALLVGLIERSSEGSDAEAESGRWSDRDAQRQASSLP